MMFGKEGQIRVWIEGEKAFGFLPASGVWYLRLGRLRLRFPRPRNLEWDDLFQALTLADFYPQSWRDWAVIPWFLARWFLAWFVTLFRTPLLKLNCWLKLRCWPVFVVTRHILPLGGGRREDTNPIICPCCLWAGMRRWAFHGYASVDGEDVEPVDECPRCGSDI